MATPHHHEIHNIMPDNEFDPVTPENAPTTPRPVSAVRLALGTIPSELKKLDRWILWKYSLVKSKSGSKWTKTPHSALGGHKIDATDFANGTTFTQAVQSLKNRKGFDGLGFLLGEGIAGIDVDDCIDADGNLNERGAAISAQYRETYAEVSPSGQGFKILVDIKSDPKLAIIGKNTPETEIYGSKRYFTVTGAKLPEHADHVAPMAQAFASTAAALGANKQALPLADMPEGGKRALGIDLKAARELLDHLPFRWCNEYWDWLRAGMALHHEFGGHIDALELWDEWSQRSPEQYDPGVCSEKWRTFGKPGKDEVTVRTLVRDAQATGWRAPHTIEQAVQDFSSFDEPEREIDEDGVAEGPLNWWWKYSVGEMLRLPAPHKEWIWRGVLRKGKVLVLAGSGGSSKSYLMLGASTQYALGNNWGPFEIAEGHKPGRVLLMYGEEDKSDVHDRLQALRHTFMLTSEQVDEVAERVAVLPLRGSSVELAKHNPQTDEVQVTEQLSRLEQRIVQYEIKLVVMDPMALMHSLEENNNNAIARFMSALDALCMRTGCSIILVHHFGKGGAMQAREVNESNVRGASALVAHARTVVVMHRLREEEAQSWGVPEADHARWVMWAVAKNNYGPSGARSWFNVDEHTGAITPAATQLVYLNNRDIREAARAHQNETMDQEITEREFQKQQVAALAEIQHFALVEFFLNTALNTGNLPGMKRAGQLAKEANMPCSASQASRAIGWIKDNRLVDPSDGLVTETGRTWLENRDF